MFDLLPDLCDLNPETFQLMDNIFKSYGRKHIFFGQVVTVRCFEDNSKVKELLATAGSGKVLVVDGGGSVKRALLGDQIAMSAIMHGWEGVVINGAIRDVGEINTMHLGVKALLPCPIKTERKGQGETQVPLQMAGVNIAPDDYLYADENGVLVAPRPLTMP